MTDINTQVQGAEFIDPTEELDLSGEGLQRQRALFTVVEATIKPSKSGKGRNASIVFAANEPIDGNEKFNVTATFVVIHEKLSVAKGGRAQLKRLFAAAYGNPEGTVADLKGKVVSAEVWEDDDGFRKIGRFQAPAEPETAETEPTLATAGITV